MKRSSEVKHSILREIYEKCGGKKWADTHMSEIRRRINCHDDSLIEDTLDIMTSDKLIKLIKYGLPHKDLSYDVYEYPKDISMQDLLSSGRFSIVPTSKARKVYEDLNSPSDSPTNLADQDVEENQQNTSNKEWDVFICHASEDKAVFATELAEDLERSGLNVWYDDFTLKMGDSLRRKIDEGLSCCKYGVVVLSEHFFKKEWPQKELDGLVAKENSKGEKVILPIWHGVTKEDVISYSLTLADRVASDSTKGISHVVMDILEVVDPEALGKYKEMGKGKKSNMSNPFDFKAPKSSTFLLKMINESSEKGFQHDKIIEFKEIVKRFENDIKSDNPEDDIKLSVHELNKLGLIIKLDDPNSPLGWHAISPDKYFFCRTDKLFQSWNPEKDARVIAKRLVRNKEGISASKLDEELKWGPRRINSAIAYLQRNETIETYGFTGKHDYICFSLKPTEETELFLSEE